jgi:hypothetical protein
VRPLLGIYPKECASGYDRATCTPMFIAALFIIAKLWKQPDVPKLMNGLRKCDIYMYIHIHIYVYVYIYIVRLRRVEREKKC